MIWCLGRLYEQERTDGDASAAGHDSTPNQDQDEVCRTDLFDSNYGSSQITDWPDEFFDDFESKLHMSYRTDMVPVPRSPNSPSLYANLSGALHVATDVLSGKGMNAFSGYSSDIGWGCMVRSAQSVLANALLFLRLGRDWKRRNSSTEATLIEKHLLQSFSDDPQAQFSIHRFVKCGEEECGKAPGEWFGPSAAARCIEALVRGDNTLQVCIGGDGATVAESTIWDQAYMDGLFTPILILVGVRLGIDVVNPIYYDALKACLQSPFTVGIAGGRPSSSHYFVALQDDYLFYFDPHYPKSALPFLSDPSLYSEEQVNTFHTRQMRRIHLGDVDPSMLLAFLITSPKDWREWRKSVEGMNTKNQGIIHVYDRQLDQILPRSRSLSKSQQLNSDQSPKSQNCDNLSGADDDSVLAMSD